MFGFGTSLASVYDYIYMWKDYHKEAHRIVENLRAVGCADGLLLELACGTGRHLEHFTNYEKIGVDLCEESLMLASFRDPKANFVCADMRSVHNQICQKIDVLLMLFGAVSYISPEEISSFFGRCVELMNDDAVVVLEPWYEDVDEGGFLHVYDSKDLKICRLSDVQDVGNQTVMEFAFMISRAGGHVERLTDKEYLWNHRLDVLEQQLANTGLICIRKTAGFTGPKGLWFLKKGRQE